MKTIELTNAIVIERGVWTKMAAADMAAAMNDLAGKSKEIIVIDSEHQFFHRNNLLRALDEVNLKNIQLISEYRGVTVTEDEVAQATAYRALRDSIVERLGDGRYVFADVPKNWDFDSTFDVKASVVRRNGYSLGLKSAQNLWKAAYPIWKGDTEVTETTRSISASGYNRTAEINAKGVTIGCQSIPRFEVEQLAIHQGWIEGPVK